MKQHLGLGLGLLGAAAGVVLVQAPVWAVPTKVTGISLTPTNTGFNIVLATKKGDRPQVFTVNQGNTFRATISNTQLALPQGSNFQQLNPAPGIAAIAVSQVNANSIEIIVTGNGNPPSGQILQTEGQQIVFSMAQSRGTTASAPAIVPPPSSTVSQAPPPPINPPIAQTTSPQPTQTNGSPNVLVPNPEITITKSDQTPLPSEIQPALDQSPPFQSRAVAPPLGDIAISNLDPSPSSINLNTSERIPRLVLRDAPVRDVLALLARAAGVNIAFATGTQTATQGQPSPAPGVASDKDAGPKISLDIENESVQDVFNYVLRITGLQANRVGRTIFVGSTLPFEARNLITRSFRLNQVQAGQAAAFLSAQGAETQRVVNIFRRTVTGEGVDRSVVEENKIEIQPLGAKQGDGALLLRGLSVLTDERLNSITLIGTPRQVEIASTFLTQLDLRRRQVAVNVKVIDINLAGQNNYSSSFSFGINNNFFVNDGGNATLNFGGINPPDALTTRNSLSSPPLIRNSIDPQNFDPFYDVNGSTINVPLTAPGGGVFVRPQAPVTNDPFRVGVSGYTPFTRVLSGENAGQLQGLGTADFSVYPLFQYPTRFLSQLQAQIQTNNAKILTDPTLVVQEGEKAGVNLTQEVITNIKTDTTAGTGLTIQRVTAEKDNAGLTLSVEITRIDDNGFISMRISPTVKAIANTQQLANNTISLLQERSLDSGLIRLRDGQTLIVSGIINDTERVTASKIPILGDLPLIGSLFRSTNKVNERAEVIVLVTPQILDDSDRSSFGYKYNPSPDARQLLQRGQPVQPRR
ncbi:general secretion pathway protein GspD [Oscillatoriales cyanobacterium USR001]|nr:general secretion pathway protein GspD [Oscillatoriales cyanobacterium USR001]